MIKTLKNVKRFFCFVVVFLLVAFSFACKGNKKPTTLATPKVTISDSGLASWERVENASSYKFTINNGDEQEIFELQIQLADGDVFSVKAVSSSSEYLDSEFSSPLKYEKKSTEEKLATPVVKIDANGLAKWEKIENATSYKISINGSNEYINVEKIEYQLSDLETISVCAVSNSDNFTNSDFSKEEKWIETIGDGTKNNPYTVGDAIKLINNKYSDGNESEEEFYFLGTVSGTPTSSDLISYRFDLVDEAGNSIVAFNINSNNIGFGANSEVVICAKLQNYGNKTPELVNGKLIMSTNVPVEIEEVTIKKLLEIGVSTKQYKITGVVSNIVNTTYGNFDLVDGEDKIYIYGLLTDKLEGKKFSSLNIFEGDTLTVIGNVVEYNGNLQIKNAVFVKVENKDATIAVNPLENGAIDEIPSTIKKGTTIRFSVTPNEGYAVGKVLANGEEISATQGYYEVVVDKDITISVEFVKEGFIPDTTKKYVFKDYPAGVQYALNEEHVLDDNVKVLTNDVHFTQELRLYSSSSHNGYAIFSLSKENLAYKGIILNAGYNETNLGIYGSVDGEKYELIKEIVVGKSYANYTIDFKTKLYKYIKLDPTLDKQIRIKDITLTFGENKVHEHEFNEKWSADEATHYHECYCGEKKDIASHTFVWVIDKEPTNDENGIKHEECTICNHKQNEGTVIQKLSHVHEWIDATCGTAKTCKTCGEVEGAPLGHDYDIINIEWKWSTFSSAIATVKCKRDGNHTFLINGTISSQIIRKPTCALEGVLIYMARISLDGIEYGDVKTVNIPKTTDHYYEDGECVVCHKILTKSIFTKVTDVSQLSEGDIIVLVSEKSSAVAKALAGKAFFNSGEYSSSIDDGNPIEIILGKKGEDWTLTTTEGVIGTTAVKKLNAKGNGTITWKISFDADGDAIIASTNSEYGRFLYNVNNPRFLNYASSVNDTMLLPQIYKYVKAKCNHNFGPLSPSVPATCVKEGVKAHYHCSICDKDYDENAKLLKDLTISKIPHDYVDGRCSVCGKIDPSEHELDFENIIWTWSGYTNAIAEIICKDNDGIKEIITATITSEITKVATCKENGINTYTATIEYDGVKYTNVVTEETTSNKHQYVENICSVCGNEITESEILDALFALEKDGKLEGTYKLTGIIIKINTAYTNKNKSITVTIKVGDKEVQCYKLVGDGIENLAVCDKITVSGELIDYKGTKEFNASCQLVSVEANQHNYGTFVDEVPATCKQEGELGHYHCDLCGKNFDVNKEELETIVIKKLAHNFVDGECTACGEKEGTQVTSKYTKVTDASTLKAGDQIVFVCESKKAVIGAFGKEKFFTRISYAENISDADNVIIITLGGSEGAWTFTTSEGLIGTSAAKALNCKGNGTTTWTISIGADGNATITSTNTSYGKILYNSGSPRFLNYTSNVSASMLLPQIYKYESSAPSCEHDYGTLIAEIPATCNAEGTIAHYECSKCHKYFDKNKNEVDSLTIEKSNSHNFVNGECTVCGEKETKKTLSADFTTKESKSNSYADSWHYGGFTIKGAANNNGGWAFVKFGGNATNLGKCNPVYIVTTDEVNFAVNEITVSIIAGSLAKNGMKVNSWGVKVQNASGNLVDTVYGGTITSKANIYSFKASDGVTWEKGYIYTVFFDLSNTTKTNGVIWVDKITLSE